MSSSQISTPSLPIDAKRHKPAVAHNWRHHLYLVVWHNQWPGNRDIYAQRMSENGQRVGPWFAVSAGTGDRIQPAVAYSATDDEYLVVWMKDVSPEVYEIWGRIIAWAGSQGLQEVASRERQVMQAPLSCSGCRGLFLSLPAEHRELCWVSYEQARSLKWDSNRIAVCALHERLKFPNESVEAPI